MKLIKDNFIEVVAGEYYTGIDKDKIDLILTETNSKYLKKEFIYNSYPKHKSNIEQVYISKKHISLNSFKDFIEEKGYETECEKEGWGWVWEGQWKKKDGVSWKVPFGNISDEIYLQNGEFIPVLQLSWYDAVEYCNWLSIRSGSAVRLPFEEEWEVFSEITGIETILEYFSKERTGYDSSEKYLNKIIFEYEKHDVVLPGLLWEWTMNWFLSYNGGIDNKDFGEVYKVLRGGSLLSQPFQRGREYRFRRCPTARSPYYGFRIAFSE